MTRIGAALQKKPDQRQIPAPGERIPEGRRAEVAFILIHGHGALEIGTGRQQ